MLKQENGKIPPRDGGYNLLLDPRANRGPVSLRKPITAERATSRGPSRASARGRPRSYQKSCPSLRRQPHIARNQVFHLRLPYPMAQPLLLRPRHLQIPQCASRSAQLTFTSLPSARNAAPTCRSPIHRRYMRTGSTVTMPSQPPQQSISVMLKQQGQLPEDFGLLPGMFPVRKQTSKVE